MSWKTECIGRVLIDMPTTADLENRHPAEFTEFRKLLAEVEKNLAAAAELAQKDRKSVV